MTKRQTALLCRMHVWRPFVPLCPNVCPTHSLRFTVCLFVFSRTFRLYSSFNSKPKAALEDALDSTVLGDLWFERGELAEARHEHRRALRIRTARLPAGHPDVAESLESLGNVAIREVSFFFFSRLKAGQNSSPPLVILPCGPQCRTAAGGLLCLLYCSFVVERRINLVANRGCFDGLDGLVECRGHNFAIFSCREGGNRTLAAQQGLALLLNF